MADPQDFAIEEVPSTYTYPPEHTGPKPIAEQIRMLAGLLRLDERDALRFIEHGSDEVLPSGAEGLFALPTLKAIARVNYLTLLNPAQQYCAAVELVLRLIGESRPFHNYREGWITPQHLRQHTRAAQALSVLSQQQQGDILVVPAQFGLWHAGKSVRRARVLMETRNDHVLEFGLGSLNVGCMLLTHPERETQRKQLHTNCAGDEFAPCTGRRFVFAPFFDYRDGRVWFGTGCVIGSTAGYGSASGFLSQAA